jgi:hypothetical protein
MNKREWILDRADVARRSGNPVRAANLLMKVYQENMQESNLIRHQIINSSRCNREWEHVPFSQF